MSKRHSAMWLGSIVYQQCSAFIPDHRSAIGRRLWACQPSFTTFFKKVRNRLYVHDARQKGGVVCHTRQQSNHVPIVLTLKEEKDQMKKEAKIIAKHCESFVPLVDHNMCTCVPHTRKTPSPEDAWLKTPTEFMPSRKCTCQQSRGSF